jgi:hypothetical protein
MTATTLSNGRTREQAMGALSKANEVRISNALTIAAIRRLRPKEKGLRAAARILRSGDMDGPLGAMSVRRLTLAPYYVNDHAAEALLKAAHIFSDKPLRRLSERQREALAAAMTEAAAYAAKRRR